MDRYSFFYVATAAYLVFIIIAILLRVPGSKDPNTNLSKLHAFCGILFLIIAGIVVVTNYGFSSENALKVILGGFFYFSFHYAIFLNFFLLATRSVSANMVAQIYEQGESVSIEMCERIYGNGKGFAYVKQDRLDWMVKKGFALFQEDHYILTSSGAAFVMISEKFLRVWGLARIVEG
jgi:hypothetical protein